MFNLSGKKALVTGASRGIGKGIAMALASQGADVAINYAQNQDKALDVKREIEAMGRQALTIKADVGNKQEIDKMFEQIKNSWHQLDILVNNAGILDFASFQDTSEEMFERIMRVNIKGQFFTAQAALSMMSNGGRIINIASIGSGGVGVGFPMISAYTASKGAVVALTESMALELGPKGITVNAVAPGAIKTDMQAGSTEESIKNTLQRIPVGRIGEPQDIGATVAFLSSEEASYVNGACVYVDGGWLAG